MPGLLDTLDNDYKEFYRTPYFILCYDALPSGISFETPMEKGKENMEAVLSSFDYQKLKLREVFKNWNTEDDKDSDSSNDYPYQYLFKSEVRSLVIWIDLHTNELFVNFLYDSADLDLEQEVISINDNLRKKFGTKKAPTFKVLTHDSRDFGTENIKNEFSQVNIDELYNDDFKEINTIIEQALEKETSGLILLHGTPGTGKTSYIKNLVSKFHASNFIFIQNEFVKDLLKPDFISFLLRNRNSILIIEDAEKVITTRENLSENSVVSTILQLTDGLFSDYLNIKIICTFNTNIEKIDKALLRKGRLIASYEFKPLSVEKSKKLLKTLGYAIDEVDLTLADIFNFDKRAFDANGDKKKIGFY